MSAHAEILAAVTAICADRQEWQFTPAEVIRALPYLSPGTIRTHVTSRLCVNAPANHAHRWPYFRRVSRGRYEVLPPYRGMPAPAVRELRPRKHLVAGEVPRAIRDTAHAVISRDVAWYVAECLEIPVIAQGRTIDEVVAGLRLALERRLDMDDPARFGLTRSPRVVLSFEFTLSRPPRR
jgi:hypothetical protein